jgi:hypothetical protein
VNWLPESKDDTGDDEVNAPLVLNELVLKDEDLELLWLPVTGGVEVE